MLPNKVESLFPQERLWIDQIVSLNSRCNPKEQIHRLQPSPSTQLCRLILGDPKICEQPSRMIGRDGSELLYDRSRCNFGETVEKEMGHDEVVPRCRRNP